jgi:tetratricopeptide (TPR) repeat protein
MLQAAQPPLATPEGVATNLLYVRSPQVLRRATLSFQALLADIYWIRAVQHYGGTKLSKAPNKQYDVLYPLLDLTSSLDPYFDVVYKFGSVFLAEPYPAGAGRPDEAIALLQKGLRTTPDKWELAQGIGFVYYWWLADYQSAAMWFNRAADMPSAPDWLRPLAAVTLAQGGNRASSRMLWTEISRNADADWLRDQASFRLKQLDALDGIDFIQRIVDQYRARTGAPPTSWDDMMRAGLLRGVPPDPTWRSVPVGASDREGDTRSAFLAQSTAERRASSLMIAAAVLLFGLGLVVGSFLNVCIYRLPREESIAWPASHCTTCNRTLRWYENVPVLSWALLRGRCRTCGSRISMRYPIVELTTGALFLAGYLAFGLTPLLAGATPLRVRDGRAVCHRPRTSDSPERDHIAGHRHRLPPQPCASARVDQLADWAARRRSVPVSDCGSLPAHPRP